MSQPLYTDVRTVLLLRDAVLQLEKEVVGAVLGDFGLFAPALAGGEDHGDTQVFSQRGPVDRHSEFIACSTPGVLAGEIAIGVTSVIVGTIL